MLVEPCRGSQAVKILRFSLVLIFVIFCSTYTQPRRYALAAMHGHWQRVKACIHIINRNLSLAII